MMDNQKRALPPLISLTENAIKRLKYLYSNAQKGKMLRITIGTKGCSGHSYQMDFVEQAQPLDEKISYGELSLLIDHKATLFLIGSVMDYEVKELEAGFTFKNPNEKGRCGCGESFHI